MTRITCLVLFAALAVAKADPVPPSSLVLQVASTGWGDAPIPDVEKLLQNTASHLMRHFSAADLKPISVEARGGPIVLHQRGPQGQLRVRLNTGDRYWAQYAFQFSHELCHILSNYDEDPTGNRWFEESLCEVASLFVLRRMGESWATNAPYASWSSYGKELTSYASQRIEKYRQPGSFVLANWYKEHSSTLAADAEVRDLNNVVAVALLPMFEAAPEHWQAVRYLNHGKPTKPQSFEEFLGDWHRNSPAKHRQFICQVARQFGVELRAS